VTCLDRVAESLAAVAQECQRRPGQRRRHATVRTCKIALRDVADIVALIGLHRPVKAELVTPILDAIEQVAGCPASERIRRPLRRNGGAK
jgi:hypothetical protein